MRDLTRECSFNSSGLSFSVSVELILVLLMGRGGNYYHVRLPPVFSVVCFFKFSGSFTSYLTFLFSEGPCFIIVRDIYFFLIGCLIQFFSFFPSLLRYLYVY